MKQTPIYDPAKTYVENVSDGPCFSGIVPKRPDTYTPIDFLGFSIRSPLGVPAGPLLNSQWIALAAKLGFDVPAYKTIRSRAHPGHPLPNILFVTERNHLAELAEQAAFSEQISITNSFGMPSMSPEFLMEDIGKANASLSPGQVMIVSVVGSMRTDISFLDDFVQAALLAKTAGAKIIEANFSCPNVHAKEGCLYTSPETVYEFAKKIKEAIHPVPLLLKVGSFPNLELMRAVFLAAQRAGCAGICGLNSVSMPVVDAHGKPALGESRKTSGICGDAIRNDALQFMRDAVAIKTTERLDLVLLGCGGLMTAEHLQLMLDAGALIAMSATGMMWNPYLASQFHQKTQLRASHANPHPTTV